MCVLYKNIGNQIDNTGGNKFKIVTGSNVYHFEGKFGITMHQYYRPVEKKPIILITSK